MTDFTLYFKHLIPNYPEWQEPPFTPFLFGEGVFFLYFPFLNQTLLILRIFPLKIAFEEVFFTNNCRVLQLKAQVAS